MAESNSNLYYRYWGKAERDGTGCHLLPYHSLDVAAVDSQRKVFIAVNE